MDVKSFQEIRQEFPTEFLVLHNCEEQEVLPNQVEILGAEKVYAFNTFQEMYAKYRTLRRQGDKATRLRSVPQIITKDL